MERYCECIVNVSSTLTASALFKTCRIIASFTLQMSIGIIPELSVSTGEFSMKL